MYLHQCISYRYDDGSTDQLKDDWESKDGVMVFSPGDDAMGFSIQMMVDDLKMQILTFGYIFPGKPRCITPTFL